MNKLQLFLKEISKPLHSDVYKKLKSLEKKLNLSKDECTNLLAESQESIKQLKNQIKNLSKPKEKDIPIERALSIFKLIPNINYKGKREINGVDIPITLNQMITPNSYLINKIRKTIKSKSNTLSSKAFAACDKIAKITGYIRDKNNFGVDDYLAYPEEVIAKGKDDCESTAQTSASIYPEIMSFCYGYWEQTPGKKIGHSWVIFCDDNGELWECEVTGLRAKMWKFGSKSEYEPQFVVTQNKTFRIKSGASFGKRVY